MHGIPGDVVRAQIDAVVDDLAPVAVKSGMLATAALVATVAQRIRHHGLGNYVLDPVMVSTSGHRLLEDGAVDEIRNDLIPLATVVTPNLEEARILTGRELRGADELEAAGRDLLELGAQAALIKGGHLDGDEAVDVLVTAEGSRTWSRRRIDTAAGHGTGCTLSAALAAGLGLGLGLEEATDAAIDFVARALEAAPGLGGGHGPINHFVRALPPD